VCSDNDGRKDSIRECRGVAALVELLAPACPAAVHEQAAGALAMLTSENGQCRDAARACGAAAALQRVLACASSAAAHERAAAALRNLACSAGYQAGAALALAARPARTARSLGLRGAARTRAQVNGGVCCTL